MLQRIASIVITLAGVALAIVVGFWVLIFLGVVALVAAVVYFVRSHVLHPHSQEKRGPDGNVIEGEFTVVDEDEEETHHDER